MAAEIIPQQGTHNLNELVGADPYFIFVLRKVNEEEDTLNATIQIDGFDTDDKLDYLVHGLLQVAEQL